MIRRRVVVHGRVQGVFFRDALREQAESHGLAGWVANRGDGAVEAELEGEEDAVDAVVRWCREGSPRAEVTDLDVTPLEPRGESGFAVR